ncbi:hypothetical protein [Agaribacterium sp. ZY112]|uniref:DoxX family protein n=1 Tax=Agaribacterium sp. ZY112 TaxID=3233574 RepID=UPI003526A603
MITPLIVLFLLVFPAVLSFIGARIFNVNYNFPPSAYWGLGLCFLFFSMGHWLKPEAMVQMLPPWVPERLTLIYLTGVLELVIGVALFTRRFQYLAALFALGVLIVFFPSNIYAALHKTGMGGHQWGPVYLLIRAPLQFILISWTWLFCLKPSYQSCKSI